MLIVTAALIVALALFAFPALRWIDIHLTQERLKDTWGEWRYGEDWGAVSALREDLNYAWLHAAGEPILIAHALGEAGLPGQNSVTALRRSLAAGLRLLEIDLWLDDSGVLRCHHGPEPPASFVAGDCTLAEALHVAAEADAWLVLDIKTDFPAAGAAIVSQFVGDAAASRLVFQLYRPSDLPLFVNWSMQLPLPGPIVTAYRARRSLRHIAAHAPHLNLRAMTFPLYRTAALGSKPDGLVWLVHPIHDCASAAAAQSVSIDGMYVHSALVAVMRAGCKR